MDTETDGNADSDIDSVQRMDNSLARIERVGHRVDVLINRPEKRNAVNEAVMADLTEAFETVGALDGVRAATLLGEGPVFCAGMDLEMMRERVDSPESFDRDAFPRLLDAIENCPVPTVAGIERAAPAGAFELTLPCDFRVLGSDASYGAIGVLGEAFRAALELRHRSDPPDRRPLARCEIHHDETRHQDEPEKRPPDEPGGGERPGGRPRPPRSQRVPRGRPP